MIHTIIIEDEPLAAQRLQLLLVEVNAQLQVQAVLHTVDEAIAYLRTHTPDLIFLDINLFDRFSFEIFEAVEVRSRIVFTTAYSEFAIKAFEQNSIDYLLKPISRESLAKSVRKFYALIREEEAPHIRHFHGDWPHRDKFLVRQGNNFSIVLTRDIAFFYAEDKYTFIMTRDGKRYPIENALTELETMLDPKSFFRINRKYVVHLEAIRSITYLSKSKLKLILHPSPPTTELITVAIEKMGGFKRWLSA